MPTVRAGALHNVILDLIAMLDSANCNISVKDIKKHMESGKVLEHLQLIAPNSTEAIEAMLPAEKILINTHLQNCVYAYAGNEDRKWGVKNDGLCLLLAFINEPLQSDGRDRQIELNE